MSIYDSNKVLFQLCLDRALEDMEKGRFVAGLERRETLINVFNETIDDLERMGKVAIETANLELPKPQFICPICATKIKAFRLLT